MKLKDPHAQYSCSNSLQHLTQQTSVNGVFRVFYATVRLCLCLAYLLSPFEIGVALPVSARLAQYFYLRVN